MKRSSRVGLFAAFLSGGLFAAFAQMATRERVTEDSATATANVAEQYLQLAADRERAGLGLPPLRRDAALVRAARAHAVEMARHNAISHQFAGEPDLAARGSAAGARFSLISENVAESPSAMRIHDAWMHSEGHRHNLLDPRVDAVGIVVIARGSQLFAVQDFAHSLQVLTLAQQEQAVAASIAASGTTVARADPTARSVCAGEAASSAMRQPAFTMRYTTADLQRIPEELGARLATGGYASATVAACPAADTGEFTLYRLAVLLYQ